MNISPAESSFGPEPGPGLGVSSVNPSVRSFSAMRWMADLGRVWVWASEADADAELRMRNLGVLGSGDGKKVKGKGDWSIGGFEGSEG